MFNIAIYNNIDIKNIKLIIENYFEKNGIEYNIIIFNTEKDLLLYCEKINILFIYIKKNSINEIKLGKNIYKKNKETKIIYITNSNEYYKEVINNVHAFAYLSEKSIKEEIENQLDNITKIANENMKFNIIKNINTKEKECEIKFININDILYFSYENRKIKIILEDKIYYFEGKMKDLNIKMEAYNFVFCHQSFLVNLKYVTKIKGYDTYLNDSIKLPVSQKRSVYFRKRVREFKKCK